MDQELIIRFSTIITAPHCLGSFICAGADPHEVLLKV